MQIIKMCCNELPWVKKPTMERLKEQNFIF
jgi:hypothetical protein